MAERTVLLDATAEAPTPRQCGSHGAQTGHPAQNPRGGLGARPRRPGPGGPRGSSRRGSMGSLSVIGTNPSGQRLAARYCWQASSVANWR